METILLFIAGALIREDFNGQFDAAKEWDVHRESDCGVLARVRAWELLRVRLVAGTVQNELKAPSSYRALLSWPNGASFGLTGAVPQARICGRISPLLRFAISGRLFVPLEPAAPFFREDMPAAVPHSQLSLFVTLTRKAELERGSLAFL